MPAQRKGTKRKAKEALSASSSKRQKKNDDSKNTSSSGSKRRRAARGLRQFSHRVCEKVQQKGTTTYTEVAKELVEEYGSSEGDPESNEIKKDAKNIRRRVYDALNVLLAMDIIGKEKKEITWKGFPANFQNQKENLVKQKEQLQSMIDAKNKQLQEIRMQGRALQTLHKQNAATPQLAETNKVYMPFIIVHTAKETTIECQMDTNSTEVFFNFSQPFEIHNDSELLMHMYREGTDEEGNPLPTGTTLTNAVQRPSDSPYSGIATTPRALGRDLTPSKVNITTPPNSTKRLRSPGGNSADILTQASPKPLFGSPNPSKGARPNRNNDGLFGEEESNPMLSEFTESDELLEQS